MKYLILLYVILIIFGIQVTSLVTPDREMGISNLPAKTFTHRPYKLTPAYEETQQITMPVIIIPDKSSYKILEVHADPNIDYKILEMPEMRKYNDSLKQQLQRDKSFRFRPHNLPNQLWKFPNSFVIPKVFIDLPSIKDFGQ